MKLHHASLKFSKKAEILFQSITAGLRDNTVWPQECMKSYLNHEYMYRVLWYSVTMSGLMELLSAKKSVIVCP